MKRKILLDNYASLLESKQFPEMETTFRITDADVIVNPKNGMVMDKTIIINLPVEVPIKDLMESNTVVSRFNTGYDLPIIPYSVQENRREVTLDDMSCLILNKSMLLNPKYARLVSESNFLIGILETIDGDATLIGNRILSTRVESLK